MVGRNKIGSNRKTKSDENEPVLFFETRFYCSILAKKKSKMEGMSEEEVARRLAQIDRETAEGRSPDGALECLLADSHLFRWHPEARGLQAAAAAGQAVPLYRAACEKGSDRARYNLSCLLLRDAHASDASRQEALALLEAAARLPRDQQPAEGAERGGISQAYARYNLARCYEKGLGVAADTSRALSLYLLASASSAPLPEALNNLGIAHLRRLFIPPTSFLLPTFSFC